MDSQFYLVVNHKGATKTVKSKPDLAWNEVAIKMSITLPDIIFKKPELEAHISVKEKDITQKTITPEIINNIQESILEHFGIAVNLNVIPVDK